MLVVGELMVRLMVMVVWLVLGQMVMRRGILGEHRERGGDMIGSRVG
jgi:hypothetical protein